MFTCAQKLTVSQLNLQHRNNPPPKKEEAKITKANKYLSQMDPRDALPSANRAVRRD